MSYLSIHTHEQLKPFCEQCQSCEWVAIDTEFLRQDTYYPKLSLVQIETEQGDAALIDPLAIDDLSPLWTLLSDDQVCKVFHSARQDIEVLFFTSKTMIKNLFDTQIAGVFLGYGHLAGFARVVEAELGIRLNKAETRTNWHQRPLTEAQQQYAFEDVHYLAPLYRKIISKLTPPQQSALQQDCNQLLDPALYQTDPALAGAKIKGIKALSGKHCTIAHKLAEWREQFAIDHDLPKKWTLSDEVITGIAKRPPKTPEALYKVPHIKSSSVKEHGASWIEVIDEVFAHPESWHKKTKSAPQPLSEQDKLLLETCTVLCQIIANQIHVNASMMISKTELTDIISHDQNRLSGWRSLLVEAPLRAFINGEASLNCHNKNIQLVHNRADATL